MVYRLLRHVCALFHGRDSGSSSDPLPTDKAHAHAGPSRRQAARCATTLRANLQESGGVQEHAHAFDLALDLGRFNRTAAHDARTAGPSMGLGYAIDNGQTRLL